MARPDVHLDRGQHERRKVQRRIALGAHRDEVMRGDAVAHMDVRCPLPRDGRAALGLPPRGRIVVAEIEQRLGRQRQDAPHRLEQRAGIAAGKVAARGADVGHEQRIPHEDRIGPRGGIGDPVGDVGGGVAGHVQGGGLQAPDGKRLAIGEQVAELRAVGGQVGRVEDAAEFPLDLRDSGADAHQPAEALLEPGRRREMVRMGVGFEQPVHPQPLGRDVGGQGLGGPGVGAPCLLVEPHDGIDDRAMAGAVVHHVRERGGGAVEKMLDGKGHGASSLGSNILYNERYFIQ